MTLSNGFDGFQSIGKYKARTLLNLENGKLHFVHDQVSIIKVKNLQQVWNSALSAFTVSVSPLLDSLWLVEQQGMGQVGNDLSKAVWSKSPSQAGTSFFHSLFRRAYKAAAGSDRSNS